MEVVMIILCTLSAESGENNFINNSGNFGIGTDTPQYKLDVSGDLIISKENSYLYFKDTNTSINSVNNNITFKTGNEVRLVIDEFGETTVDGILSIDTLKIKGNLFDSAAASSWTSTSSSYPGINVNFSVGINNQNRNNDYLNFKPIFNLDVKGNIRSDNIFFGENNIKIIPELFNTSLYQNNDFDSIYYGIYQTQELNGSNANPVWQLFDGDEDTVCILDDNSIAETVYIKSELNDDNILEDVEYTVNGAYFDLIFSKRFVIRNYSMSYNTDISDNKLLPKSWYLLGKTHLDDDNTIDQEDNKWKLIDHKNFTTDWFIEHDSFTKIFDFNTEHYRNEKYLRLRFIANKSYTVDLTVDPPDNRNTNEWFSTFW